MHIVMIKKTLSLSYCAINTCHLRWHRVYLNGAWTLSLLTFGYSI